MIVTNLSLNETNFKAIQRANFLLNDHLYDFFYIVYMHKLKK